MVMEAIRACMPPGLRGDAMSSSARYGWFISWATNLLQLDGLNSNPDGTSRIPGLRAYVDRVRQWSTEGQIWLQRADERVKEMLDVLDGADQRDKLFEALYAEQVGRDTQGRTYTGTISDEVLRNNFGLNDEAIALRHKIKEDFQAYLNQMEEVAMADIDARLGQPGQEFQNRIMKDRVRQDFRKMRSKPYFPLMRFGQWTMTIRDADGRIVEFQQFESRRERDEAAQKAARLYTNRDRSIRTGKMTDQLMAFQGLPPAFARLLASKLNLDAQQQRDLNDLLLKMAPEQSFRRQMARRKKTKGFSTDGMRSYANYFFRGANHLARIKHSQQLLNSIKQVKQQRDLSGLIEDSTQYDGIAEYLQKHYDYIMNPKGEWAGLRAFGFLWYLGFMPKSAFVNLTQVPLVTLPYLGVRYGDATAMGALNKSIKDTWTYMFKNRGLSDDERGAMHWLLETGLIDQSFATELAAFADKSFMSRVMGDNPMNRAGRDVVGKGAYIFGLAEKANRRVTALAAYRLHRDALLGERTWDSLNDAEKADIQTKAQESAMKAIENTQFEYASWNRAPFMRGKKSVIFLFMNYVQNMLFFVARDPGRSRYMAMMLFAAGLQGLPFAEDLLDLIDQMFSTRNQKFNVRKELRDLLEDLSLNPDMLMLGAGHNSFGLGYLGQMTGLPIPEVDIRGSLTMGRPINLTEAFMPVGDVNADRMTSDIVEGAGGAALAIPINVIRFFTSDTPSDWKRAELLMPSVLKAFSKSIRYTAQGEETTLAGNPLVDFDIANGQDVSEIVLQLMGFTPTDVSQSRLAYMEGKEVEMFYKIRRRKLMGALHYERRQSSSAGVKEALDAITTYNREVPFPELRISRKDLVTSQKNRDRNLAKVKIGQALQERYVRAVSDTRESFTSDAQ